MKICILFVLVLSFSLRGFSQQLKSETNVLGVEKLSKTSKHLYFFKPDQTIRIQTLDGRKWKSADYLYADNFLILNSRDTIWFDTISWIKGKIYGDNGRKIIGVILAIGTAPFVILIPLVANGFGATLLGITAVPFAAVGYGGIKLASARKFYRKNDCHVRVFTR